MLDLLCKVNRVQQLNHRNMEDAWGFSKPRTMQKFYIQQGFTLFGSKTSSEMKRQNIYKK